MATETIKFKLHFSNHLAELTFQQSVHRQNPLKVKTLSPEHKL